jgi:lipopolysaccharide/colanic/teichoic acid biosynthesis glycosyltransferase
VSLSERWSDPELRNPGVMSLEGADPTLIHREWQATNTLWSLLQRLVALLMLIAALPLLILLYVPVRVSARRPFLFSQVRPGFMRRPFTIKKVTTMRAGSEKVAKFERGVGLDDPAITRIGRILRDCKIDELPQLWNVVRGDMEFVGPRPIAPGLHDMLVEHIPRFNTRYLVKPGLTNVGQVSVVENRLGDDAIEDWRRRFEGEEHYIKHKSVSYDLIIITMTVVYMLRKGLRQLLGRRKGGGGDKPPAHAGSKA